MPPKELADQLVQILFNYASCVNEETLECFKNDDGSFSPVGLSKEQAYIIRIFLSKLSEDFPFIIKSEDRYVQTT